MDIGKVLLGGTLAGALVVVVLASNERQPKLASATVHTSSDPPPAMRTAERAPVAERPMEIAREPALPAPAAEPEPAPVARVTPAPATAPRPAATRSKGDGYDYEIPPPAPPNKEGAQAGGHGARR
jgi:hypothetical protein